MKYLILPCIAIFLFSKENIQAQDLYFPGYAPSFSVTTSLNKKLGINFLAATKVRVGHYTIKSVEYTPLLLEIYSQLLASYKINSRWQMGGGYGFQRNNPFRNDWRNEHRIVQQAIYSIPAGKIKFNNRFRFEQRWFSYPNNARDFSTRARYQAGIVKQFNKNLYWQLNNEIYAITSGRRFSFISENWLYSGVGFPVKSLGHFETGIGYNSVVRNKDKEWLSLILLQINWSFVIPSVMKKEMHPVMHARHF